jgi:hypothetical protein
MPAVPAGAGSTPVEHEHLAPVIALVHPHEHSWALRDTEYDNGLTLHRFECDGCSAVRFT